MIFYNATLQMIDHSCSIEMNRNLSHCILEQADVLTIDLLKTRLFCERIYVDLEIGVDENISLKQAHTIAHHVHDVLEKTFPEIKHCMIHVNPMKKEE